MRSETYSFLGWGVGLSVFMLTLNPLAFIGSYLGVRVPEIGRVSHSLAVGLAVLVGGVICFCSGWVGVLFFSFSLAYVTHLFFDALVKGIPADFTGVCTVKLGLKSEFFAGLLIFLFWVGIGVVGLSVLGTDYTVLVRTSLIGKVLGLLTKIV